MRDEGNFGPNYRRGLVLGLTLAEIFFLLIFLLLATFAYLLSMQERKWLPVLKELQTHDLPRETPEQIRTSMQKMSTAYRDVSEFEKQI